MENAQYGKAMSAEPTIYPDIDESSTVASDDLGNGEIYDSNDRLISIRFVDLVDRSKIHTLLPGQKAVIPPVSRRRAPRNVKLNDEGAILSGVTIENAGARNSVVSTLGLCQVSQDDFRTLEWNKLRDYGEIGDGIKIDHTGLVLSRNRDQGFGKQIQGAFAIVGQGLR